MSNVQVSFDNVQVYLKCMDLSILKFSAMQCWSWLLTINCSTMQSGYMNQTGMLRRAFAHFNCAHLSHLLMVTNCHVQQQWWRYQVNQEFHLVVLFEFIWRWAGPSIRHHDRGRGATSGVTRPPLPATNWQGGSCDQARLTRDWGRGELGPLKHPRHLCPMVKCDSSGCRTRCWLDAGGDRGEGGNTASLKHLRHLRGDLWAASRQPPASCGPLLPARFSCGQKLFT